MRCGNVRVGHWLVIKDNWIKFTFCIDVGTLLIPDNYSDITVASAEPGSHVRVKRSPQGFFRERLRERFGLGGYQQQQPLVAPVGGSAATASSESRGFQIRGPFGGGISFGRSNANSQAVSNGK